MEPKYQMIFISIKTQTLHCYDADNQSVSYGISSGKNGVGEGMGSECTPRGWHKVHALIGGNVPENSVFVGRVPTGEVYSPLLAEKNPDRDWILTRIVQLDGLEIGRNKNGQVDTLKRYIYIHGTPDGTQIGSPGSHGCIRMRNHDIISVFQSITLGTLVCIE